MMMPFAYDIIDPCALIWIPAKYSLIHDSDARENVPPSFYILYMFLVKQSYWPDIAC